MGNRRTFVSATFFTGIVGGFLLWLFGPSNTCIVGFSGVLFGWFGVLTVGFFLECPPKWWRLVMMSVVGFIMGGTFLVEVLSGDDQEGVSWHGHFLGFLSGVIYGVLRFRRQWFLCHGFEDRVRPLGSQASLVSSVSMLMRELCGRLRASAVDIGDACRCQPPREEPPGVTTKPREEATSSTSTAPSAQSYGGQSAQTHASQTEGVAPGSGGVDSFGQPLTPRYD